MNDWSRGVILDTALFWVVLQNENFLPKFPLADVENVIFKGDYQ